MSSPAYEPRRNLNCETSYSELDSRIDNIIKKNMMWSLGAGIIPIPLVDMAGIIAVQAKMLKEISNEHNIPYCENAVKNSLASLAAGLGSVWVGAAAVQFTTLIPVIGPVMHSLTVPVMAASFTYAVGTVFHQHFKTGGTFLNFDSSSMKDSFKSAFDKGKELSKNMKGQ